MKKKYTAAILALSLASTSLCAQEIIDDTEAILQEENELSPTPEELSQSDVYLQQQEAASQQVQPVSQKVEDISKTTETVSKKQPQAVSPKVEETATKTEQVQPILSKSEEKESLTEKKEEKETIEASKIITVNQFQHFTVELTGTKWTYLGEEGEEKYISYDGMAEKEKTTEFYIYAEKAGSTLLHFYKSDIIGKTYLDQYIQIDIKANASLTKKQANSVQTTSTENQAISEEKQADTKQTVQNDKQAIPAEKKRASVYKETLDPTSFKIESKQESIDSPSETDTILAKAKEAYENANYAEAKSLLDTFFSNAITNLDEGLFIQGQILEAFSPVQNIRGALSSYKNLLNTYPLSPFAKEAEKRAIYLERFYFDIY